MRKRIQQLATGKFEYVRPLLSFSTDKVDIEVLEGKDYTGDFVITSANRVPMRGIIYTSDARMECLTPQFEGEEVRIRYQFHSNGLVEGDIQKGEFFIICNQGEYNLSFVASISRLYAETSVGKIRSLNDFVGLAKESQTEAYHLFYSKSFRNIIKQEQKKQLLLYEGLSKGAMSSQKVEEFLVGIGKKQRNHIVPEMTEAEFYQVTEPRKETLVIHRSQWGYVDIKVRVDADFIVPAKSELTENDFLGSICNFDYYINEQALHAGKNFGRIYFSFPGDEFSFTVCVSSGKKREAAEATDSREVKEGRARLVMLYMDYRLKKIVTGAWASQSIEILNHLMALEPERELYSLMKAQALIVNKQRQEATWIMEEFKHGCVDRESPEWGYYRYLCTLMEREPSYVDRIAEEVEILFRKNPDSSLLFWVLTFLRESYYKSSSKRYKAIEQWIKKGNYSPYLYLEAYYLLLQDPYLLGHLEEFEISVLNWARKQNAITKEIALQVMHLVPQLRTFDSYVYRILEECYRVCPKDEMLTVICGYLIKGQQYDTKYHRWYELGIEHEIRITSLYEAYLMSLDNRQIESVPKMIWMYFRYESTLPYEQKAVLFVNIIAGKQKQPEVYQKYRRMIEQFAMEQMEEGHISDNLAVIYDEMLRLGVLSGELAHRLSDILFTHKLTCLDKRISQAVIWHEELREPQIVKFVNGVAYFKAYTKNYCVVLEDTSENFFCQSVAYQDEAMMYPKVYLNSCLALAPDEISYVLYYMREMRQDGETDADEGGYLLKLLQSEQISREYKAELLAELIRYYRNKEQEFAHGAKAIEEYVKQSGMELLARETRRELIELLIEMRLYDSAYRLIQADGYEYLKKSARVALCSYGITEQGFEEDDFWLGFAASTFALGKYNDVILMYLCKYYNGATKMMAKLWKAAGEFEIDTFDLEERILTQMLYTTDYTPYAEEIYDSYYMGGGKEPVCMAYLSYFANAYLTQDAVVPSHVFLQIKERFLEGQELNAACRLGLLKHLAEKESLSPKQMQIADTLLGENISKNIYFSFYRRLPAELVYKHHLYDKFFLEYHAKPNRRVMVHFRLGNEAYREEELEEVYEGIYVMQFTLFFGETVQYYITEADSMTEQVMESNCIVNNDMFAQEKQGRYFELNETLLQAALEDEEALKSQMKKYYQMLRVTEEAFQLL